MQRRPVTQFIAFLFFVCRVCQNAIPEGIVYQIVWNFTANDEFLDSVNCILQWLPPEFLFFIVWYSRDIFTDAFVELTQHINQISMRCGNCALLIFFINPQQLFLIDHCWCAVRQTMARSCAWSERAFTREALHTCTGTIPPVSQQLNQASHTFLHRGSSGPRNISISLSPATCRV